MIKVSFYAFLMAVSLPQLGRAAGDHVQIMTFPEGSLENASLHSLESKDAGLFGPGCERGFSLRSAPNEAGQRVDTTTLITAFALSGVYGTRGGKEYLAKNDRFVRELFISNRLHPDQLSIYLGVQTMPANLFMQTQPGIPVSLHGSPKNLSVIPENGNYFESFIRFLQKLQTAEGLTELTDELLGSILVDVATDSLWTVGAQKQADFWDVGKAFVRLPMSFQIEPENPLPQVLGPQQIAVELGRANGRHIERKVKMATINLIRQAIAYGVEPENAFFFAKSPESDSHDQLYHLHFGMSLFAPHHSRISLAKALTLDAYKPRLFSDLVAKYAAIFPALDDFEIIKFHTSLRHSLFTLLDYRRPVSDTRASNPPLVVLDLTLSGHAAAERILLATGVTKEQKAKVEDLIYRAELSINGPFLNDTVDKSITEASPARNLYVYNLDAEAASLRSSYLKDIVVGMYRWQFRKAVANTTLPLSANDLRLIFLQKNFGINFVTRKPHLRDGLRALGGIVKEHSSEGPDGDEIIFNIHFDAARLLQLSQSRDQNEQVISEGYWQRRHDLVEWFL